MTDPRPPLCPSRLWSRLAFLASGAAFAFAVGLAPQAAQAAGATIGGKAGTSGVSGSGGMNSGAKGKKKGFQLPERVAQGNAISLLMPVQVGFAGYMPRVRIALQYDRQIQKAHWVYLGAAALLDRGDFKTFKLGSCGLGTRGVVQQGHGRGL